MPYMSILYEGNEAGAARRHTGTRELMVDTPQFPGIHQLSYPRERGDQPLRLSKCLNSRQSFAQDEGVNVLSMERLNSCSE